MKSIKEEITLREITIELLERDYPEDKWLVNELKKEIEELKR